MRKKKTLIIGMFAILAMAVQACGHNDNNTNNQEITKSVAPGETIPPDGQVSLNETLLPNDSTALDETLLPNGQVSLDETGKTENTVNTDSPKPEQSTDGNSPTKPEDENGNGSNKPEVTSTVPRTKIPDELLAGIPRKTSSANVEQGDENEQSANENEIPANESVEPTATKPATTKNPYFVVHPSATPEATGVFGDSSNKRVIVNGTGYDFCIKNTWHIRNVEENDGLSVDVALTQSNVGYDEFVENISVVINDLSAYDVDLEKYKGITDTQFAAAGYVVKSIEKTKVGGYDAYSYEFERNQEGIELKYYQVFTLKDKKSYLFTFASDADAYDSLIDEVKAGFATITFTDK